MDKIKLKVALIHKGWPQWRLAAELDMSPSSFSAVVHGKHPNSAKITREAEKLLGLEEGSLLPDREN